MLKGLQLALDAAPDAASARPVLDGLALAIRLAGVVGLDTLCEKFVGGALSIRSQCLLYRHTCDPFRLIKSAPEFLCFYPHTALAAASGISSPAEPGSNLEAKQVTALAVLVSLAGGPEAGLLGSGWVIVLRTLSQLDTLQAELARRAIDKLAAEVNASLYRWSRLYAL